MVDAGLITLSTFVSPYREDRAKVRTILEDNFIEIFIDTSIEECMNRDIKGLYKKAKEGTITNLSGYNAPYEMPLNPDIHIKTEGRTIDECAQKIWNEIENRIQL